MLKKEKDRIRKMLKRTEGNRKKYKGKGKELEDINKR